MKSTIKFTKMHGAGNDYIYINAMQCNEVLSPEIIRSMSTYHFGIGSDGVVFILPSEIADFQMRMFNSDGSEAEMCGNASRCVGKFVFDKGLTDKTQIALETKAGIKYLALHIEKGVVTTVTVDMGEPILEATTIPTVGYEVSPVVAQPLSVEGEEYKLTAVSMGNPHAVFFVDEITDQLVDEVGKKIEVHPAFPRRTNVEFAQIIDKETIKMRVWERGAGETLACGTGACATLVAAVLNGMTDRKATLKLVGGDLSIEWCEADNHVMMTGGATTVFEGEIVINN